MMNLGGSFMRVLVMVVALTLMLSIAPAGEAQPLSLADVLVAPPYLKLEAHISSPPSWELNGGSDVTVGVNVEKPGRSLEALIAKVMRYVRLLLRAEPHPPVAADVVYVPAGRFLMGSDDVGAMEFERPQHRVVLQAFWIHRSAVTNQQYRDCIEAGVCEGDVADHPDDDLPAVGITWHQAAGYCTWAGGRLPTEAEWEKAARGTRGRRYPWGDAEPTCDRANFLDCRVGLMPVGSYPAGASPYGTLDMAGNTWEWVEDQYTETYYEPSPDQDDADHAIYDWRILRGGCHVSRAQDLRASHRNWARADASSTLYGFRCAFDADR